MTHQERMLASAKIYREEHGLSIFPVKAKAKKPVVEWKMYQQEKPSMDQVVSWWGKDFPGANIGCVTGEINDRTVVDLDFYKNSTLKNRINEIVPDSYATQIATSPRGGEHWHFKYDKTLSTTSGGDSAIDIRNDGGFIMMPPSVGDNAKRYSWKIKDIAINTIPAPLLSFIKTLFLSSTSTSSSNIYIEPTNNASQNLTKPNISFSEGCRDQSLFHIANHLVKGGMPQDNILDCLNFIASHCSPPFPQKDVLIKLESAIKRSGLNKKSAAEEVREFIELTSSNFNLTELSQYLTKPNKENMQPVYMALSRMVKQGILERTDNRTGVYRKVESQFETVDINGLDVGDEIDIRLPFSFERYIEIMPKDLMVFAGEPNAGKTAIMFEVMRRNMNQWKIYYFSSEMGAVNCKKRLMKHGGMKVSDWKFEFIDDFPNFVDVIQPDDFNIIDYVEVVDGEYYKIPGILTQIQRKLKKGVAVVALQTNKGMEYAIGGQQTKAKPALYCTISPLDNGNKMKIGKAKNFKDHNPNGWFYNFYIKNGIQLLPKSDMWGPE